MKNVSNQFARKIKHLKRRLSGKTPMIAAAVVSICAALALSFFYDNEVIYPSSQADAAELTDAGELAAESQVAMITVHVCGEVADEGVYDLPLGSRVCDAVDAAGGFTECADRAKLNLARVLNDAEQVYIPSASAGYYDGAAQASEPAGRGLVNINTASAEELQTLSGIGSATAQKIISYRANYGPFGSIEEIKNVSGIGEKKFEAIESMICV